MANAWTTMKYFLRSFLIVSGRRRFSRALVVANWLKRRHFGIANEVLLSRLHVRLGVYIHPKAEVSSDLRCPHPTGIVIGEGVVIKGNVTIYQQVTLGSAGPTSSKPGYPQLMEGVVIFAGAKVIGGIRIGRKAIVGANSVVLDDVPDFCIAAGIPAKLIGKNNV